jgi:stage II sporulation protein D
MNRILKIFFTAILPVVCITGQLCAVHPTERQTVQVKHMPKGPTVKLLVLQDVEGALVETKSSYNIYDPKTGKKLDRAYTSASYYMHPTVDGIKWGQEFPGIYQVLLVPDDPKSTILVHGIEYHGMIYAYQVEGTIGFVNEVGIDQYAESAVSALTQGQTLDKEAYAALLIAARTDAMNKISNPKTKYWDIKADQTLYQGAGNSCREKAFLEACQSTSQMVLHTTQAVAWFSTSTAPLQEIQQKAGEGKDAKAILTELVPQADISLANR